MVDMVGASCCTASFGNVCLGDEEIVMELDHLTLAEYQVHPDATFPAIFGGRVLSSVSERRPVTPPPINPADLGFVSVGAQADNSPDLSGYSNISRSSYEMLDK